MVNTQNEPWVEFLFEGPQDAGVEARAVGQLLVDLNTAARHVVADLFGTGEPRGRVSNQERALIGFTLKEVGPGSRLRIELAPPSLDLGLSLSFEESIAQAPTADLVMQELAEDITQRRNGHSAFRPSRREAINAVNSSLRRIGSAVTIAGRSVDTVNPIPIPLQSTAQSSQATAFERRVLFGRATMADANPTRRRVRATLYDGRRYTLDVDNELPIPLSAFFDRDVEFRVLDELSEGEVVSSVVDAVRLLEPAEVGIDFPARDWRRLAEEQGIDLANPPNYPELMRGLFDTTEAVRAFRQHLLESRGNYDFDE